MEQKCTDDNFRGAFSADKVHKYFKGQEKPSVEGNSHYVDPLFPPTNQSILSQDEKGNYIDPEDGPLKSKDVDISNIEWKRAEEIFNGKYLLFEDKIEFSDIKQGNLGNCYFLSAIAALTEYSHLIYEIFRTKEKNPLGFYEIVLFIDGHWKVVVVDDYFPVVKGTNNLKFARPNGNEIWVILLEKAWAKVNGGYTNIISGWPSDPLAALTGFATQKLTHKEYDKEELYNILKNADQSDNIMCTSTKNDGSVETFGLVVNHAYTLIGAKETVDSTGKLIRLVRIRNPWGYKEWNGDWSDKSSLWTEELRKFYDYQDSDDGTFYMSIDDFYKLYECTHVCYIMYDSNIKSFHVEKDHIDKAHVFNLHLEADSKFAVSIINKHWRYNRNLKSVTHPISIIIAKYDPKNQSVKQVDGDYSAYENLEFVKELKQGFYVIWIYCAYEYCKEPKPHKYMIRFISSSKFKVRLETFDNHFELIRNLILAGVKEKNAKAIAEKEVFQVIENSYKRTGIGYRCIINKSKTVYQKWENNTTEIQRIFMLPPYEGKQTFEFFVPPSGEAIVCGMRNEQWKTYWFNLKSSFTNLSCKAGEDPTKTKCINFEHFCAKDVLLDEITDDYYDYFSSGLAEAKKELKFSHIDISEIIIEDLEKQHPVFMEILLKLDPADNDRELTWGKLSYDNGIYVGQFDQNKIRNGRGAYHWLKEGIVYAGYWVNNVREKYGVLLDKNFNKTYEGGYLKGFKNGFGKLYFSNKDRYEGEYVKDKRHGKGTYYWADGSIWIGPFVNSQMNGKGMYYPADGGEPWEVEYANGQLV